MQPETGFVKPVAHEMPAPSTWLLDESFMLGEADCGPESERQDVLNYTGALGEKHNDNPGNFIGIYLVTPVNILANARPILIVKGMQQVKRNFLEKCLRKNLSLKIEMPKNIEEVILMANSDLLWISIVHLIKNSIKFTANGNITLGFFVHKTSMVFFVTAVGICISETSKEAIFKPFAQQNIFDYSVGKAKGASSSIINGALQSLYKKISIKTCRDGASTFCFTIPLGNATITYKLSLP